METTDTPETEEEFQPLTGHERQIERFGKLVYDVADYVAEISKQNNLSVNETCQATANGIMRLLDGGWCYAPRFELTPVPYDPALRVTDRQLGLTPELIAANPWMAERDLQKKWREDMQEMNPEGWIYNKPIERPFASVLSPTHGALGLSHSETYDYYRERLAISAKDLFT